MRGRRRRGTSRREGTPPRGRSGARNARRSGPSSACWSWRWTVGVGRVAGEPELDQLGSPGPRAGVTLGQQRVDGAGLDGVLVDPELDVALHRRAGGGVPAGLEVDHDDRAVGGELEPVGGAGQPHPLAVVELDLRLERARCRAPCAGWRRASAGTGSSAARTRSSSRAFDHGVRNSIRSQTSSTWPISTSTRRAGVELAGARPARRARARSGRCWRTGGTRRRRRPRAGGTTGSGRRSCASSTLAETGTGGRGRAPADRPGRRAGAPPGRRVGLRAPAGGRRWSRRPAGPGGARRRARSGSLVAGSATVRRSSLTRPAIDSGRGGRPSTSSTVTPSSSRNRDGCSPSSSGEATAVTTSRSRARVQAT